MEVSLSCREGVGVRNINDVFLTLAGNRSLQVRKFKIPLNWCDPHWFFSDKKGSAELGSPPMCCILCPNSWTIFFIRVKKMLTIIVNNVWVFYFGWPTNQWGFWFLTIKSFMSNIKLWNFPDGQVTKTLSSQSRGPGSIPDWWTRSHISQLRPGTAKYIKINNKY